MKLEAGDIFLTYNPMWLGRAINAVQRFWAKDNASEYSHCGLIIDYEGTTFEALWTVRRQNLYKAYQGKKVLIVRFVEMTPEKFRVGMERIQKHEGQIYPVLRLPLHALNIAKFIHWCLVVCSELVAKFLAAVGARHKYWFGTNVDNLADEVKRERGYVVIFEGVLDGVLDGVLELSPLEEKRQ